MADLALDTLLHGNLDNLPTKPSSIVRIFTSSTFTGMSLSFPYGTYLDFHICFPFLSFPPLPRLLSSPDTAVERNALMEKVYPRLREYCRSRHNLSFQV